MRGVVYLVAILVLIAIIYQLFIFIEMRILFEPVRSHVWTPDQPYGDVIFGRSHLHGWIFTSEQNPIVLYCHGNTGNISHRRYIVDLCQSMQLSLFLFDYRGYGHSKGQSSLQSLKEDGDDAYRYLQSIGYPDSRIIVWGESLGGLVATSIATRHQPHRLLLMATFADLASLSRDSKTLIGTIAHPFLKIQGESNLNRIDKITTPTLVAHSIDDEIIPYSQGQMLYQRIKHPDKKFISMQGRHGSPKISLDQVRDILDFCQCSSNIESDCVNILDYIASENRKHGR